METVVSPERFLGLSCQGSSLGARRLGNPKGQWEQVGILNITPLLLSPQGLEWKLPSHVQGNGGEELEVIRVLFLPVEPLKWRQEKNKQTQVISPGPWKRSLSQPGM